MKLVDRILLVLFCLVIVVLAGYLLGSMVGFLPPVYFQFVQYQIEVALATCLMLVLALRFLYLGVIPAERKQQYGFVHAGEFGQIRISLSALEQIAEQVVNNERGVKRAHIGLQLVGDTVLFHVRVAASGQQNLVALAESLQKAIKEQVERLTNVTVRDVAIVFSAVGNDRPRPL